jgi:hypothetical protein
LHSGRAGHCLRPAAELDLGDVRVFEHESRPLEMEQIFFRVVENEKQPVVNNIKLFSSSLMKTP